LNRLARSDELGRHAIDRFHFPRDAQSWRQGSRASEEDVVWETRWELSREQDHAAGRHFSNI
jgi:hypothetical protein